MSIGSDCRQLCRSLRELTKELGSPVSLNQLKERSGMDQIRFNLAVAEAVNCKGMEWADVNKSQIIEGNNQMSQPDPDKEASIPYIRFSPEAQPIWERIWLAVLATGLVIFVGYLITQKATFSPQTWKLATVLASILAAAVGAFLTGMLEVRHERPGLGVRATGAFGAFVLVLIVLLI